MHPVGFLAAVGWTIPPYRNSQEMLSMLQTKTHSSPEFLGVLSITTKRNVWMKGFDLEQIYTNEFVCMFGRWTLLDSCKGKRRRTPQSRLSDTSAVLMYFWFTRFLQHNNFFINHPVDVMSLSIRIGPEEMLRHQRTCNGCVAHQRCLALSQGLVRWISMTQGSTGL